MITSEQAIKKYGNPLTDQLNWERKNMIMFDINDTINQANPVIPNRIYCNKDFGVVVDKWLTALYEHKLLEEIKTWDGCFNVRKMRGINALSLHAFGIAIDINASHNPLNVSREQCVLKGLVPFTEEFVKVSRNIVDCGWDWSSRFDGMHFQLKS